MGGVHTRQHRPKLITRRGLCLGVGGGLRPEQGGQQPGPPEGEAGFDDRLGGGG